MRLLKSFCLCLSICVLALSASAQTPGMILNYFVGTWTGKTTFAGRDKSLKDVACAIQGKGVVAGKYLQLDINMFVAGAPDEEMVMITFNPMTHLWEAWTFNQHTAGAHLTTGVPGPDENTIVLSSPGIVLNGENTAYRETLKILKKNEFTITYEMRHYDQKQKADVWAVVYTSDYTRKEGSL